MTVHPDGANVVRVATVHVPAGSHTVVLRGLAASIDPSSIRVEGEGTARLAIGAVDVRATPGDAERKAEPALEARIAALKAERDGLLGRIEAQEGRKRAIQSFAEAGGGGRERPPLPVDQWRAAWDAVGDGLERVAAAIAELQRKVEKLDDEIAALERARPQQPPPGQPRRTVTIALDSPAEAEATLRITYRVAGARWSPAYDVRLDTGAKDRKPSLELVRRAVVSQATGEDWSETALTVSTNRANRGTQAPELPDMLVSLVDPAEAARKAELAARVQRRAAAEQASPMASVMAPRPAAPAAADAIEAQEQMAEIEAGGFQASFRVAGRVSLPADGTVRTYALSSRKVEPTLVVKAAPVVDETAYLEASFAHDEEAPLLAGPVSLHRDGIYVGRGHLPQKAPGEAVDLGFGADDRVKVSRVPVRRQAQEPGWIGNTRNDTRAFRTTVRNLHDTAMRIVVVDQTPVSENAAVTVEPLAGMTPPTEKAVKDRRGVSAWGYEYKPGEQREILHGWRVAWPADRELVSGGAPQPLRR